MTLSLRTRSALALAAVASLVATALPGQTFTRILGSGDPIPGGPGSVQFFTQAPAVGGGAVAFTAVDTTPGLPIEALFRYSSGSFERVVGVGDGVPAWGQVLQGISRLALDSDGSVAFLGMSQSGLFGVMTDQGGTLRALLGSNTAIPNGRGATFTTIANVSLRADGGFIAFSGGGRIGASAFSGVFTAETATGRVRTLAWEGTAVTGLGTLLGTSQCDVRDGRVAFAAKVQTPSGTVDGIYLCDPVGGPLTFVVDTTVINPVTGQPFGNVRSPEVDEDDVAFHGFEGTFSNQGIHSTHAAPIPAGVNLPGVGPARSLERFHLDRERLVFEATDSTPSSNSLGLFFYDCGTITKIIAPGDQLSGKTVSRIIHGDEALDGDRLALLVNFDDNSEAVYVVELSAMTGFESYGAGLAGELGLTPRIEGYDCPAVGTTFRIELRDGPSTLLGGLFLGLTPLNTPLLGGTVLASPDFVASLMLQPPAPGLPRPWATLALVLPPDPTLVGTLLYTQAHYVDSAAAQGVSFTPGLRIEVR